MRRDKVVAKKHNQRRIPRSDRDQVDSSFIDNIDLGIAFPGTIIQSKVFTMANSRGPFMILVAILALTTQIDAARESNNIGHYAAKKLSNANARNLNRQLSKSGKSGVSHVSSGGKSGKIEASGKADKEHPVAEEVGSKVGKEPANGVASKVGKEDDDDDDDDDHMTGSDAGDDGYTWSDDVNTTETPDMEDDAEWSADNSTDIVDDDDYSVHSGKSGKGHKASGKSGKFIKSSEDDDDDEYYVMSIDSSADHDDHIHSGKSGKGNVAPVADDDDDDDDAGAISGDHSHDDDDHHSHDDDNNHHHGHHHHQHSGKSGKGSKSGSKSGKGSKQMKSGKSGGHHHDDDYHSGSGDNHSHMPTVMPTPCGKAGKDCDIIVPTMAPTPCGKAGKECEDTDDSLPIIPTEPPIISTIPPGVTGTTELPDMPTLPPVMATSPPVDDTVPPPIVTPPVTPPSVPATSPPVIETTPPVTSTLVPITVAPTAPTDSETPTWSPTMMPTTTIDGLTTKGTWFESGGKSFFADELEYAREKKDPNDIGFAFAERADGVGENSSSRQSSINVAMLGFLSGAVLFLQHLLG